MNASAFRHFYEYHFSENRKIWDRYVALLTYEQFIQDAGYSYGSVRAQITHLINADELWFSELQGIEPPGPLPSTNFDDREIIRTYWDNLENKMRNYLAKLQDDALFDKPIKNQKTTKT